MLHTIRNRQKKQLRESSGHRYALYLLALSVISQVFLYAEANLTRRFTLDSLHGKYLDCHVHTAGIPLLTHTGKESSFVGAKDSLCDPFRLELPLKLGLTVIAAHVGTPGKNHGQENFERALIMLGRYPNLYADISSLTQINKLRYLGNILPV